MAIPHTVGLTGVDRQRIQEFQCIADVTSTDGRLSQLRTLNRG
ncbi:MULTISPECIES: hypothetical protein [Pseudomonas]|nr:MULTISPECIES: hypothetical protein [Pseudomonas]MCP1457997.1 hypothetical protein [Pseudomonas kilonensis]WPN62684.1 hypothetical protein QMK48_23790 [Pseudomonas sp. P9_32]WPN68439.1 hypothetical protein QMK47_24690 [Pseudomonas sp. P9_35]